MELDFKAHYQVAGYEGIAFYLAGYAKEMTEGEDILICEDEECDHQTSEMCWLYNEPEEVDSDDKVIAIMVGDDHRHTIDISDLTMINEDDYCKGCGQIGCTGDGR